MIGIKKTERVFIDKRTNQVMVRVRWNGEEVNFALKCKAEFDKWNPESQRPKGGTQHKFDNVTYSARIITRMIDEQLEGIHEAFAQYELQNAIPTRQALKDSVIKILDPGQKSVVVKKTLSELYEDFMNKASSERNWTKKVHQKYRQVWTHLHEYDKNISLEDLTKDKMNGFKNWFVAKGFRNGTIIKSINFLKSFLRWVKAEGYDVQQSALAYQCNLTTVPRTVTCLNHDELMRFYKYQFKSDALARARDLFCFMSFTSLRYSDLVALKRCNVHEDHIDVCIHKTGKTVQIPIIDEAKAIIKKYKPIQCKNGAMFHVPANQVLNRDLKDAAKEAGLDREICMVYYKGTTRIEEVKQFYDLLSCHDARRTFVCTSLALGIPPNIIMACTGHENYATMKPYIDISDDTVKKEMSKWDGKIEAPTSKKEAILDILKSLPEEKLTQMLVSLLG